MFKPNIAKPFTFFNVNAPQMIKSNLGDKRTRDHAVIINKAHVRCVVRASQCVTSWRQKTSNYAYNLRHELTHWFATL